MPLGVQSRDVVFHDWLVATSTLGGKHVEVIIATVRLSIPLMEAVLAELLTALSAEEVLRVPGLLQCRHAFLLDKR